MFPAPHMKGRKVAVFGLGATGLAAARALAASGADVYSWDDQESARAAFKNAGDKPAPPEDWPWSDLAALVLSPGVPLTHPAPHPIVQKARSAGVDIIGDIELFARTLNGLEASVRPKIVAITGSNGKSTTTALIGHMLKQTGFDVCIGGNIGAAVMGLAPPVAGRVYVLELSSFQLDLARSLRADVAALLNISPDHIDRHGSLEKYIEAKMRIFLNQQGEDAAVIGVDDVHAQAALATLRKTSPTRLTPVSAQGALGRGVFAIGGKIFSNLDGKTIEAGDISAIGSLQGAHNWQNAAAATAAVAALGVPPAVAVRAMERFEGLPHRMEQIARIGATLFVNDSKATNADAASKALMAYKDVFWIAGGKAKEGGVAALRPLMMRVRTAYLIGEAARAFEEQLAGAVPCVQCGDLAQALARASRDAAQSGLEKPVVLLSPACASYDQFKNYEERGDVFRALVLAAARRGGEAA